MSIEEPSDGADSLPKLLLCEDGEWYVLEFEDQDIENEKNDKGWSCYLIGGMEVVSEDDEIVIEEGTNEVPFWAQKAFYKSYSSLNKSDKKGVIQFRYKRDEIKGGKSKATIKVL